MRHECACSRSRDIGHRRRAAAQPALLILDEAANGRDPAGILEIRELLRSLKGQGVTILVSSHLLVEVEQMAEAHEERT